LKITITALALTLILAGGQALSQTVALDLAKCREGAQAIAMSIGGAAAVNQTRAVVTILYALEPDIAISYFCGPLSPTHSLNVTWASAAPTPDTLNVITEASATFAGAASSTVRKKLTACMSEARKGMKADADGEAEVAIDGTKMSMSCQIFSRRGGAVNVTAKD
jgi:hypothetical protein